jgi:hypothetical protein
VFGKYGSDKGECARKNKPRRHSSVHEQVSLLINKIVVMCRNIQRQGNVVFGEFFQKILCQLEWIAWLCHWYIIATE